MRRDKVRVDCLHPGNIQSNQPHWGGVKTTVGVSDKSSHFDRYDILGDAAGNGLEPPSLCVSEFARAEEDIGSKDPCPEQLPEDGGNPIQSLARYDHVGYLGETHHSHPRPWATFCSMKLPWTSVPGIPNEL